MTTKIPAAHLRLKRAYDPPADGDGLRILVDRLWPRGLAKDKAALDGWMKDVAPSTNLRKWFGHDPARWQEFRQRYHAELRDQPALDQLHDLAAAHTVTLIYSARDPDHNQAVVLRDLLTGAA